MDTSSAAKKFADAASHGRIFQNTLSSFVVLLQTFRSNESSHAADPTETEATFRFESFAVSHQLGA